MNKFFITTIVVVAIVIGGFFAYDNRNAEFEETPETTQEEPRDKLMSVESHVAQNISALSPIAASMGGTFYVTKVSVDPQARRGVVEYEDGHMAYEAEFTYTADDRTGYVVTSFVIKE